MKGLLASLLLAVVLLTGCGGANDVTQLITSTPDAAALQVAETNLTAASTAMQAYFSEHGSYDGVSTAALLALDPGLGSSVTAATGSGGSYCLQSVVRGVTASLHGPGGTPQAGPCA